MDRHRRRLVRVVGAAALLMAVGCGPAATITWQPGNLRPLVVGWEQFFRVQWHARPEDGHALVEGYITNVWGFPALNLQLLITGYDQSGQQTGQLIAWGPSEIDYGARVYFSVPVPSASTYDVAILAWNWVQSGNGGALR